MPSFKDYTGKRFGRLLILDEHKIINKHRLWLCKCDCGNLKWVRLEGCLSGKTKSCGCLSKEIVQLKRKELYGLSTKNKIYNGYIRNARKANLDFQLTKEQFFNLTNKNCFYCGSKPSNILKSRYNNGDYIYNGIDRVDNTKGYIKNNCVPCCKFCNFIKKDIDYRVFKEWILNVYNNMHETDKTYSLYIGRWQSPGGPHDGHISLINDALKRNKNVLIAFRDTKIDDKNPYTVNQRIEWFNKRFKEEIDKGIIKLIRICDIDEVCYGRGVGWGIRQIHLDKETESISATKLRAQKK